jgi:hypothetical protein
VEANSAHATTGNSAVCASGKRKRKEGEMTDWRKFDEATPRTFIGEIGVVDFVIVEAVVEETAEARARRIWGMDEKEPQHVH